MAIYVDNAIFWAQLRIRGGWKNLLTITLTYACIAIFSITFFHGLAETPRSKSDVLDFSAIMILVVQTVMMLLLGSARPSPIPFAAMSPIDRSNPIG